MLLQDIGAGYVVTTFYTATTNWEAKSFDYFCFHLHQQATRRPPGRIAGVYDCLPATNP